MTAMDRFDQRVASLIEEVATPRYPDYFDDVLDVAVRRPQRSAWTFPERWLPMSAIARRPAFVPAFVPGSVGLLLLIALLIAAIFAVAVGTQRRVPPPYGPAANGSLTYSEAGDIYARDLATGTETLLVGGPGTDVSPVFSRDGTRLAFIRVDAEDAGTLMVANADGSGARLLAGPEAGVDWWEWSPSGSEIVIVSSAPGAPRLSVVRVDGEVVRRPLDVPFIPQTATWRPPDGRELIVLGADGGLFAVYAVAADGGAVERVSLEGGPDTYWPPFVPTSDGRVVAYTSATDAIHLRFLELDTGRDWTYTELPALTEDPAPADQREYSGSPILSPDGTKVAFGRYWNEHGGTINHQVWVASLAGDGSDAVAVGPLHQSRSGHNPFSYAFAPDGTSVIIQMNEVAETWQANPAGGSPVRLPWGRTVGDWIDWQRLAP